MNGYTRSSKVLLTCTDNIKSVKTICVVTPLLSAQPGRLPAPQQPVTSLGDGVMSR